MREGDAGDFQIHRSNAHALRAELAEHLRGLGVPAKDGPVGGEFDIPLELRVGNNLPIEIVVPVDFREPAPQPSSMVAMASAFSSPDSRNRARKTVPRGYSAPEFGEMVGIKNQQFLSRRFAPRATRVRVSSRIRSRDRP